MYNTKLDSDVCRDGSHLKIIDLSDYNNKDNCLDYSDEKCVKVWLE